MRIRNEQDLQTYRRTHGHGWRYIHLTDRRFKLYHHGSRQMTYPTTSEEVQEALRQMRESRQ